MILRRLRFQYVPDNRYFMAVPVFLTDRHRGKLYFVIKFQLRYPCPEAGKGDHQAVNVPAFDRGQQDVLPVGCGFGVAHIMLI